MAHRKEYRFHYYERADSIAGEGEKLVISEGVISD